MIKVGAIVRVLNWGAMYTTPRDWFDTHEDIDRDLLMRFAWDDGRPDSMASPFYSKDKEFEVVYLDNDCLEPRALISRLPSSSGATNYWPVYCVGIDGLEESSLELTMEEIEAKFGRKVKIVEKKQDAIPF